MFSLTYVWTNSDFGVIYAWSNSGLCLVLHCPVGDLRLVLCNPLHVFGQTPTPSPLPSHYPAHTIIRSRNWFLLFFLFFLRVTPPFVNGSFNFLLQTR